MNRLIRQHPPPYPLCDFLCGMNASEAWRNTILEKRGHFVYVYDNGNKNAKNYQPRVDDLPQNALVIALTWAGKFFIWPVLIGRATVAMNACSQGTVSSRLSHSSLRFRLQLLFAFNFFLF